MNRGPRVPGASE